MADETCVMEDSDMLTHNVPGVAGSAAKDLAPPELLKVGCVVESYIGSIGYAAFE
jgi:hypothetical protein